MLIKTPTSKKLEFWHEMSKEAVSHKLSILKERNFNFENLWRSSANSSDIPGSEFRSEEQLKQILQYHPMWEELKGLLTSGAEFKVEKISEEKRLMFLRKSLMKGNHIKENNKEEAQVLEEFARKEFKLGHVIILPKETVTIVPELEICPLGIVRQNTVDTLENREEKVRIVHDLSFNVEEGGSVKDRINLEDYPEVQYGHALQRILHTIHHFRRRDKINRNLLAKFDCDNAYRIVHLCINSILKVAFIIGKFLFLSLRLPFEAKPSAALWGVVSEVLCDLSNLLAKREEFWQFLKEKPEHYETLQEPILEKEDILIEEALSIENEVLIKEEIQNNIYVDDLISICIHGEDGEIEN